MSTAAKTASPTPAAGAVIDGYTVERELVGHHAAELRYAVFGPDRSPATLIAASERHGGRAESARFRRLAARRAQLDHPAAIRIRAITEQGGHSILITDAFPDRTFGSVLENEAPLPPERVIAMLAPVAEALDLAHARGLVHRNLTANSLLLTDDGRLLLDTFGLLADEDALARTVAEARSLRYRSPEEAAGEPLGRTANVYSLAALVVHALTGAAPYQSERRTVLYSQEEELPSRASEVAWRLVNAISGGSRIGAGVPAIVHTSLTPMPVRVSDRMPHLGEAIDAVLARGMANDPGGRHPSVTALLKDVAGALGVPWPEPSAPAAALPRLQLVTDRMHPVVHAPAPANTGHPRRLATAAVAGALACGALVAVAATPFGHDEPAPARAANPAAWSALDDERTALHDDLATARTPGAQATAAAGLAGVYTEASRAGGPPALTAAAREAASAYARLAAAAENGDASGWAAAASSARESEARLSLAASRH